METVSLVERTNTWKPFVESINGAIAAKDFRKSTVSAILRMVDPALSMWPGSLYAYGLGWLIGPGFVSGRNRLYKKPFERFLTHRRSYFQDAPLAAIQAFNSFVAALFPPAEVPLLRIDEQVARRRMSRAEETVRQGAAARLSICTKFSALPEELASSSPAAAQQKRVEAKSPPLFSKDSPPQPPLGSKLAELLEAARRSLALKAQNTLNQLSLLQVKIQNVEDFAQQIREVANKPFDQAFLAQATQKQTIQEAASSVNGWLAEQDQRFAEILSEAKQKIQRIETLEAEAERLKAVLLPLQARRGSREEAEEGIRQLASIPVPTAVLEQGSLSEIEKALIKGEELLKAASQRITSQFHIRITALQAANRRTHTIELAFIASRWEIFSALSPYADLRRATISARQNFLETLASLEPKLDKEELSLQGYASALLAASYHPDIRLIRGKIASRAMRLKDLRTAIERELRDLDRKLHLLTLAGVAQEQLLAERAWLFAFLKKIRRPYQVFQDAYDPDSINALFRYWWNDLERYRSGHVARLRIFSQAIEGRATGLLRAIGRALESVDKVQGSASFRHDLLQQAPTSIPALEAWLNARATTMLGVALPLLAALPQPEQEALIERILLIDAKVKELYSFAKAVQATNPVEGDQIDALLEPVAACLCIEAMEVPSPALLTLHAQKAEKMLHAIEGALLAEIALIDEKIGQALGDPASEIIPKACVKIPAILSEVSESLRCSQNHQDPYLSSIAYFLLGEARRILQALAQSGFTAAALSEIFQSIAVLLFHNRLLEQAKAQRDYAHVFLLVPATQQLADRCKQLAGSADLPGHALDGIGDVTISPWEVAMPDQLQKGALCQKLQKIVSFSKQILLSSGQTEGQESLLVPGIEGIATQLAEDKPFGAPRISFIPGDISYFWK